VSSGALSAALASAAEAKPLDLPSDLPERFLMPARERRTEPEPVASHIQLVMAALSKERL